MSRYSTRSYDYGAGSSSSSSSSRYDSTTSSSYKGFDPTTTGSYRGSNLTGYGSSRAGSSYSSNGVSSSSSASSGLGSYSSRTRSGGDTAAALPRSTSFGRGEVLSTSTTRYESDIKASYSSSLSRSSSLPTHSQELRSYRRAGALQSDSSTDKDSALTDRQLRLAQRRRQREEQETSSDNSKEPSVERGTSLRRDSDSDSVASLGSSYTRRRLRDKAAELGIGSSLSEEKEEKDGSADVVQSSYRRSRRIRDGSWSSEDSTQTASSLGSGVTEPTDSATSGSETLASFRRRRQLETQTSGDSETAVSGRLDSNGVDDPMQLTLELKRSRRQQRLEAGKQTGGSQDEDVGKSDDSSVTSTEATTRSWRQRLHEADGSGVKQGETDPDTGSRRRSYDAESETSSRRRSTDTESESVGRQRSFRGVGDPTSNRDDPPERAALGARRVSLEVAEVETRAERIARYKEERRKQLAHIASITSGSGSEEREPDVLPSLFTAAKREKEETTDSDKQTPTRSDTAAGGSSLMSRLNSLRSASDEARLDKLTTVIESGEKNDVTNTSHKKNSDLANVITVAAESKKVSSGKDSSVESTKSSAKPGDSTVSSRVIQRASASPEPGPRHKSPAPSTAKTSTSGQDSSSSRKLSSNSKDQSSKRPSSLSSEQSSTRKLSESSSDRRSAKSPSPVSSRLMVATKSSAAKEHSTTRPTRGSASPSSSSSLSPRGSPAPSDGARSSRSATSSAVCASTKTQPAIKQTLMPERGTKEAQATSAAGRTSVSEEKKDESARGSKYMVRLPKAAQSEAESNKGKDRESPQRTTKSGGGAPKLSSSSFSAASSTRSSDRDSGFGSAWLSSSSFSSTRSPDKDTEGKLHVPTAKAARLQRMPHVEVSSSSSREGSEEKVHVGKDSLSNKNASPAVKRTSSLPSRRVAEAASSGDKASVSSTIRERSTSQNKKERTSSSSSQESTALHKHVSEPRSSSTRTTRTSSKEDVVKDVGPAKPLSVDTSVGISAQSAPLKSPPIALDDLLARNAEYLSSDEDAGDSPRSSEHRTLKSGEDPRLRRSLRRKLLQKSGSGSSRDDSSRSARESKEVEGNEAAADVTATITLPTSASAAQVEEGSVFHVSDTASGDSDASATFAVSNTNRGASRKTQSAHDAVAGSVADKKKTLADDSKKSSADDRRTWDATVTQEDDTKKTLANERKKTEEGIAAEGKKKEVSPDSDSVFETATSDVSLSESSSVEAVHRTRKDKSALRKSDLNKASPEDGSSQANKEGGSRNQLDEVSDIRNRFAQGFTSADAKAKPHQTDHEAKLPQRSSSRGKEFSQLLQKFSTSDNSSSERSDSDTGPQRHRNFVKRQEAREPQQSSSDDAADAGSTRRTPVRTQSLKANRSAEGKEERVVERSGSFRSDFMRKRFSPVRLSDEPSEELSAVLSRRHEEVDKQLQDEEKTDDRRGDRRLGRAERYKTTKVEEVIVDSEVAATLKARRMKTDTNSERDANSGKDVNKRLAVSGSDMSNLDKSLEVLARVTHELDEKEASPETERLRLATTPDTKMRAHNKAAMQEAEKLISDVETRISSSLHLKKTATGKAAHNVSQVKEKSPSPSSSATPTVTQSFAYEESENKRSAIAAEKETSHVFPSLSRDRSSSERETPSKISTTKQTVHSKNDAESATVTLSHTERARSISERERSNSVDKHSSQEITSTVTLALPTSLSFSQNTAVTTDLGSPTSASPLISPRSPTNIRRTESLKESPSVTRSESFERKKGILKRTPSMPKQEARPVVDPQLAKIMQQRRQRELELEEAKEEEELAESGTRRPRTKSAAEEIEESVRQMKELKKKEDETEEEAALCMPVSDRIFKMQSKIEEDKHLPITPKSRGSGQHTPRSARSWSGSITPRRQISVDEGVAETIPEVPATVSEELSGPQLMEKLTSLAAKSADFQERRHKFQKRGKEDWRTRTQPVTLEEIQEADSLDSVSAFRAAVRRNASKNMFEHLKTVEQQRPLPTKVTEFPQHLVPDKRKRRGRDQRYKTLPITAEELNAIPEGELAGPATLRETHVWKRDSRTDSGILSGSEMDSLVSDSLRSLSLEMDTSDNDPSRMSVSSKASLFRSLDEKAKAEREKEKSASGAKRYIDRKKRERSRTQPVTDDEVKTAAEFADGEKKQVPQVKIPQPEVVNRPKSPSVEEEQPEEEDQLTKLSLAEKVKLFQQRQAEEAASKQPPPRTEAPAPPRRRQRKPASRFNTQPVTPEELAKASKISPLAMSLVKPPDPELLMGLPLKDQQELMMLHAEATLSQCSSRASSRPSSQPGSRRGSFTTPVTLASSADNVSHKASEETSITTIISTTETSSTSSIHKQSSFDSEPRGILKKTKSTESVPSDNPTFKVSDNATFRPIQPDDAKTPTSRSNGATDTSTPSPNIAHDVGDSSHKKAEPEEDRYSPVAELLLPKPSESAAGAAAMFYLDSDNLGGESSTDPAEPDKDNNADQDSKRRPRFSGRKEQKERYLTQPAPELTPERSPQSKRKFKYEGRHMTQPITPDEMKEAESATMPEGLGDKTVSGGSIADRLSQLKTSGEESWRKRVSRDKLNEVDTPTGPIIDIKPQDNKHLAPVRPTTIADRICKIGESAEQWRGRVEETDAKEFTVATKLAKSGPGPVLGSESPLVAKLRASKKDLTKDDSSNASSPVTTPTTPTKEFLPKVPLPKEIVVDPAAVKKAEETKKTNGSTLNDNSEMAEPVRVEVPTLDDEEIEQFFATKEITEISDKVDMDIDDFDNIFIEANEILHSVRKIRPNRKQKATSRNPLRTVSQFVEIQTEYIQVSSGTAEKELRRLKTEGFAREAGLAQAALAGLASKENFSKVALRKTDESSVPAALVGRHNPFQDLMLLHVKGRKNVQTRIVEPHAKSMNAGDCYILVTPDKIINWVGVYSNIIEKAKSAEVASFIQQKRDMGYRGTAVVQTVDQAKDHLGAGKHFWIALHGDKECQGCGPDEEDELYESSITKTNMIYRLSDGALQPYEQYWGALPRHEMLEEKEVLVFDFGSEFYVWQGKSVTMEQRKQGMALARKLWDKGYDYSQCAVNPLGPLRSEEDGGIPDSALKRPEWCIFGKINQNMETIVFREKFYDWPDTSRLIGVKGRKSTEMKSEFVDIKAYDAKKMIPVNGAPVTLKLEGADVGRGKKWAEDMQGFIKEQDILTLGVKVWHVMEYEHYQMPEDSYGQFHKGDTYVVRWQYMITNAGLKSLKGQAARHSLTGRERCAYFFWQGQDSTINEKGASALMTVELDEERGPQVRVVQGKEPPCFLSLFEGGMIVHIGKREDASTNTPGPWKMYCLRGDDAGELCLLEIPVSIAHFRSQSSLILLNVRTGMAYVWHGVKSPQHVRELAVGAVKNLKGKCPLELTMHKDAHIVITEVEEGQEKSEIWSALDSRDRSLYHSLLKDPARYDYTPRLFYMTSVSMVFEVTEQMNPARIPGTYTSFPFFQSDLYRASQPALFLLDVGSAVYLWQGWWPTATEEGENVHTGSATSRFNNDRRCALETTLNYCKERAHSGKAPVAYLVAAGVEPLAFQNMFPFWETDPNVHSLALEDGKHEGYCELVEEVYTKLTQTRYSLQELQERPLPDGVDPLKLETYLTDEEFEEVLDMKKDEFYALPAWKQAQVKQSLGLF